MLWCQRRIGLWNVGFNSWELKSKTIDSMGILWERQVQKCINNWTFNLAKESLASFLLSLSFALIISLFILSMIENSNLGCLFLHSQYCHIASEPCSVTEHKDRWTAKWTRKKEGLCTSLPLPSIYGGFKSQSHFTTSSGHPNLRPCGKWQWFRNGSFSMAASW